MTVQQQIDQLNAIKQQALIWRTGGTLLLLGIAGWSVWSLYDAATGLASQGPRQEAFISSVQEGLKEEVLPKVQTLATTTLTEVQRDIQTELEKLNERVPELSEATMKELDALQTNLPTMGEKLINDKFEGILKEREGKIREMYPSVTPEQVTTLVQNLSEVGKKEVIQANMDLFGPHQRHLQNIIRSMRQIKATEKAGTQTPNWELGLAVLDVLRDDLKKLNPENGKPAAKLAQKKEVKA